MTLVKTFQVCCKQQPFFDKIFPSRTSMDIFLLENTGISAQSSNYSIEIKMVIKISLTEFTTLRTRICKNGKKNETIRFNMMFKTLPLYIIFFYKIGKKKPTNNPT